MDKVTMSLLHRFLIILLLVISISGCKVMEYRLDECASSSIIVDRSDSRNHASLRHGSGNSDGLFAQYSYDSDSYVVCANRWFRGQGYSVPTDPWYYTAQYYIEAPDHNDISPLRDRRMTLSGWFKTSSSGGTIIAKAGNASNTREYRVYIEGGTLKVSFWNQYGSPSTFAIASFVSDDSWHAFAVTARISGNNIQVKKYFDGSSIGTEIGHSFSYCTNTSGTLIIGAMKWSNTSISDYFDGYIDELVMTDDVESSSDLEDAYLNQLAHKNDSGTSRSCLSCSVGIHDFLVTHDGYGINCVAEEVTITARNSDDTVADDYTGTISLLTSTNHGTWTLKIGNGSFSDATVDDGEASYTFSVADDGVVVLELLDSYDESVNIAVSDGSIADDDSDGPLNFNPIGFVMSPNPLGTQVGCKPFPFTLTAVGQTVDHPECGVIEEYTGNKSLKFWFDYSAPTTGTETPVVGGTSITESVSGAASQTVAFINGVATVAAQYNDAGKIQIFARDDAGIGEPVAGTSSEIVGGLAPFVVRPFAIDLQVVGNPVAQATNGSIFTTSGTSFTLNLRAVCWQSDDDGNSDGVADGHNDNDPTNNANLTDNTLTLNAAGRVAIAHKLWKPAGGVAGTLAGTTSATLTNGVGSLDDLTYSEVGIIELAVTLDDYLNGGEDVVGKSGAVGRFYPHHFALEGGTLSTRSDLTCTSAPTFTYLDENLTFAYKLTAQNETGSTTANYGDGTDGFAKFAGTGAVNYGSAGTYTIGAVDDPDGTPTTLSERVEIVSSSKVSGWTAGAATFNVELNVDRLAAPDGPFSDTRFGVAVQDSDGVEITSPDLDVDADTTKDHTQATAAAKLRYGRLRLDNAHGSEMLLLPMLMRAEFWSGAAFSWNAIDSCTPFTAAELTLTSDVETGVNPIKVKDALTTTATINNNPLTSGDGDLDFSAPGVGGDGWVDVGLDVPNYLQFNWHGSGDENPTARATFGIYQGNQRIIYIRETTWR